MIAAKLALEDNDVGVMEGAALAEGGEAWDGAVAKGGGGGDKGSQISFNFCVFT